MARALGVLLVALFLGGDIASCSEEYSGAQLLQVENNRPEILQKLVSDDDLDVWSRNITHSDILVPKDKLESVKAVLNESGTDYKIKISNVQARINSENRAVRTRSGERMSWNQYQTLETIYKWLDQLAGRNSFVSVGSIGRTVENRPIKYIKISSGKPNAKAMLIDGGIHAREWVSPASVTYMINELVNNRDRLSPALRDLDFYIIPVLNPDGYEFTHSSNRLWRKNRSKGPRSGCFGSDLNRNFDDHWGGKGTSGDCSAEIYRGSGPASELEIQAMQKFTLSLRNVQGYVSFHSYGRYIMLPYGDDYYHKPSDIRDLENVADAAVAAIERLSGNYYQAGTIANVMYPSAGGSVDWMKSTARIKYTLGVELGHGNNGFLLPSYEIVPTAKEAWEIIKTVAAAIAKL